MKVEIHRSDLVRLIGQVQTIVPTKSASPILMTVLLEAEGGTLTLTATDTFISMRVYGQAIVSEPGAIALPAKCLFQLVRELTTTQVELSLLSAETALVQAGSSHFRIQGMHKDLFPSFPDLSIGTRINLHAGTFKEMLVRTRFAIGNDISRKVFNGICFEQVGSFAQFTATDGRKLARNRVEIPGPIPGANGYIFSEKSVDEMIKMIEDPENTLSIILMEDKVGIELDGALLVSRLILGPYPDVSRVIPPKSDQPLSLHREELMSLLKQLSLFTTVEKNSIRFSFVEGALHLSAASGEVGDGKVSMPVNYRGDPLEIAFSPKDFLEILRHTKDETVSFGITGTYNPGLITDSTEAQFIIMPMRLDA